MYPSGLRYRSKAGPNPHFLDSQYFLDHVLAPFDVAFREHTGPFIFEFQRSGLEPDTFLPRFDAFLARLPKAYEYAVEVRNPAVLGPEYREILHEHSVRHVYHYLYAMSSLDQQHEKLKYQFTAPFVLFRLLTPRDKKYHDAVKAYEPYDKLVQPLSDMREQTVRIVKAAIGAGRRVYVLTSNRSEGNAPGTMRALADMLRVASGE